MFLRTATSCAPDAPTLASRSRSSVGPTGLRKDISVGDGGKQARSPGRARRKPLKPLRAGTSGDSGVLVVTRVRSTNTKCTRGRGCNGHPAFPTPSKGERFINGSGALRGEVANVYVGLEQRHCEPTGRANARPMTGSAKQSISPHKRMDCFVASLLAMTVLHLNRRGCLKIESGIHAGLSPRLLRLDAGFARQANPFFDVGVHQSRELLGAVTRGLEALLDEEFFDLGRFERLHDGLVEPVNDRPRRVGRGEHTVPSRYFVVGEASFRDRWYLRCHREPL